jgi:hypothetical protein
MLRTKSSPRILPSTTPRFGTVDAARNSRRRKKSRSFAGLGLPHVRLCCKGAEPHARFAQDAKTPRNEDRGIRLPCFASLRLCVSQFVPFVLFVVKEPQIPEPRITKSPRNLPSTTPRFGNGGSRKKLKRTQKQPVVRGPVPLCVSASLRETSPFPSEARHVVLAQRTAKRISAAFFEALPTLSVNQGNGGKKPPSLKAAKEGRDAGESKRSERGLVARPFVILRRPFRASARLFPDPRGDAPGCLESPPWG